MGGSPAANSPPASCPACASCMRQSHPCPPATAARAPDGTGIPVSPAAADAQHSGGPGGCAPGQRGIWVFTGRWAALWKYAARHSLPADTVAHMMQSRPRGGAQDGTPGGGGGRTSGRRRSPRPPSCRRCGRRPRPRTPRCSGSSTVSWGRRPACGQAPLASLPPSVCRPDLHHRWEGFGESGFTAGSEMCSVHHRSMPRCRPMRGLGNWFRG